MKSNRRQWLKRGALFVPTIFVPRLIAQPRQVSDWWLEAARPVVSGCTTGRDANTADQTSVTSGNSGTYVHFAMKVTPSASYTCCRCDLYLDRQGNPDYNLLVGLWSHNSDDNEPNALIGSESNAVAASTLNEGTETTVTFDGLSVALTASTVYWIVMRSTNAPSPSNWVRWYRITATGDVRADADGVGPWTSVSTSRLQKYKLWSS
jgi:hypothetical protein